MLNLREIHKPKTIQDAISLLRNPGTVALAGGTQLISARRKDVQAVVDLSALGLSYIRDQRGVVAIGATTVLADVVNSPMLRAAANGVIAQAAHRTASSILRNQGTLVGTLITEPDGILAAALLALDAQIICAGTETNARAIRVSPLPLVDFFANPDPLVSGAIVTELVIPAASLGKRAALETVGRTPRDKPIVTVCAAARVEGKTVRDVRIALGGVAQSAVRAKRVEAALEGKDLRDSEIEGLAQLAAESLSPRGDYRGSVKYRQAMAVVLTRRAVQQLIA